MVLSFGETLWDLLPTGAVLGGAPLNLAYRMTGLGDDGRIVTRLGRDDLGRKAFELATQLGLDTRFVQWDDDRPTGTVEVELDGAGNPDYTIIPDVAYDRIEPADELLRAAGQADCICFGTLIQRTDVARATLGRLLDYGSHSLKLLDINLRRNCYTPQTIDESLSRADVLKLNDAEAAELAGMFGLPGDGIRDLCSEMIRRWSLAHCLVTLGERGVLAASDDGGVTYVPGYRVEVADTCGAGDACTAGFLHRLLGEAPTADCCRLGNVLGAMVATQQGATVPIEAAAVEEFISGAHERIVDSALESLAVL